MKVLVIVVMLLLLSVPIFAEQKYNAFENRWETVPDNSNWQTQYNAFENEWSYQPDNAEMEYNAFEDTWDWNSGHNPEQSWEINNLAWQAMQE